MKQRVERGALKQPEKIGAAAAEILGRHHGQRYFQWELRQGKFHYAAHEVNFAREQLLEGKYVMQTEERDLTPLEAVAAYKELNEVERGFAQSRPAGAMGHLRVRLAGGTRRETLSDRHDRRRRQRVAGALRAARLQRREPPFAEDVSGTQRSAPGFLHQPPHPDEAHRALWPEHDLDSVAMAPAVSTRSQTGSYPPFLSSRSSSRLSSSESSTQSTRNAFDIYSPPSLAAR